VRLPNSQQDVSWIVGEISLEELWKFVDTIKVGNTGFALIVGDDNHLIAHGNPDEKRHIANADQSRALEELNFAAGFRAGRYASDQYTETRQMMVAGGTTL